MKNSLLGLSLLSVGFCAGYYVSSRHHLLPPAVCPDLSLCDTVMIRDTLRMSIPVAVSDSVAITSVTRRLPIAPSCRAVPHSCRDSSTSVSVPLPDTGPDSVGVEVPIVRKVYADSAFRAVVSGFEPKLDSLVIYPRLVAVKPRSVRRRPWGIGVSAGVCVSQRGISPGISIGLTYNFLSF